MRNKIAIALAVIITGTVCGAQAQGEKKMLTLTSPAFKPHQSIPVKYTCQGENVNPPLLIGNIPGGTKSLALIMDDPDAPAGVWVHWVLYNISPTDRIAENSIPGHQGINDFRRANYGGPCPPSGKHRYFFKLYALDEMLSLTGEVRRGDLLKAMEGRVLGKAELIGLYRKE